MPLSSPPLINEACVNAFRIPTASPESDGTLEWQSTTMILVEIQAAGIEALGYTYADIATAKYIDSTLLPLIHLKDATQISKLTQDMLSVGRNSGQTGITAMAVSAVNNALWDLKAKLYQQSVVNLLGGVREKIAAYASGGFTSYSLNQLREQAETWQEQCYQKVKIKIGRNPQEDIARVCTVRQTLGPDIELFVDANGAYDKKQALHFAELFREFNVTWFEEPVRSTDLDGLLYLTNRAPAKMHISAGEYGYDHYYFKRMLQHKAVDVLQADATRCGGISGFMQADTLCQSFDTPLSSHCAPALHVHACCAALSSCHLENFFDHERIEAMLFENSPTVYNGFISPDRGEAGFGLKFKHSDAQPYMQNF